MTYDTNVNKDRLIVKTMKFNETNQNDQHETQMPLEMNSFSTTILPHQILKKMHQKGISNRLIESLDHFGEANSKGKLDFYHSSIRIDYKEYSNRFKVSISIQLHPIL